MTREEERRQAADKYVDNFGCKKKDTPVLSAYYLGYVAGAEWADAQPRSPWISVEDRLPEINQVVLTLGSEQNDEDVRLLWRGDVSGNFVCIDYDEITHWMPIPELQTTK